jgi:hypothetical protein
MGRMDEIRARREAMTSENWRCKPCECGHPSCTDYLLNITKSDGRFEKEDAEFIANAPADVDYLLALVDGRDQEEMEFLHKAIEAAENLKAANQSLLKQNESLHRALEEIHEYERVVHPGSKSWSIANSALPHKAGGGIVNSRSNG